MDRNELTPHLEELKRVLENKVSEDKLIEELEKYIGTYHLDIEAAKRGIMRKYGGVMTQFVTADSVVKKIKDLTGDEKSVDIVAKVIYVEDKDITVKGVQKSITSGIICDETGSVPFTVWEGHADLDKGSVYRFKNCYSKKWNDKISISLGKSGSIDRADNVKIDTPERNYSMSSSEMKIGDIREGVGNVTVTGRILTTEIREIMVKEQPKTVYSGLIADDSGKIQYSAWNDYGLKEGETICVKNAYIRAWKGIPQLNLGDRCEISRVDDTFDESKIGGSNEKTVGEIVKNGGGIDIVISGTVIDVRMGSGLIKRCPQCNRSILNDECITHGAVEPILDLRMKVVVDDGTGSISAILNRECTEKLTDVTLKMATDLAKARNDYQFIAKELTTRILIKHVKIRGNVMSDDYGPMMIVKSADIDDIDVHAEAEKLLKDVEAVL